MIDQSGLLDSHFREDLLGVAIQVGDDETDDVLARGCVQRLPLEGLVAEGQRGAILRGGLGDFAAGIQVQPAFLDGEGVAGLGGDLTRGAQLAGPGDAGDTGQLAVAEVQAGAAGLAGIGEGVGAIHGINSLLGAGAVILGLEEGGNRLLPVAEGEDNRFPLELEREITASAPIWVVHSVDLAGIRAFQEVGIGQEDRIGSLVVIADEQVDEADVLTADIGAQQGRLAGRGGLAGEPDR